MISSSTLAPSSRLTTSRPTTPASSASSSSSLGASFSTDDAKAVEDAAKAKGVKIPLIDGYRNARMTEKLELSAKMPALVELRKGVVAKVTGVASEADVQKALA